MSHVALRTALIWHDEVMSDVVVDKPTADHARQRGQVDVRRARCRPPDELRGRAARQPRLPADARRADARHDLPRRRGEGRRGVRAARRRGRGPGRIPRDADQRQGLGRRRSRRVRRLQAVLPVRPARRRAGVLHQAGDATPASAAACSRALVLCRSLFLLKRPTSSTRPIVPRRRACRRSRSMLGGARSCWLMRAGRRVAGVVRVLA